MAKVIKMDMRQWATHLQQLGSRFQPAMVRGMVAGAARTIPFLQQRTMMAKPASPRGAVGAINTGLYKAGWRSASIPNGARVFNTQPYSGIIEHGRRPSKVGADGVRNLEAWARRRLQIPANQAKAAAWAIAKTLEDRKLEARKVLTGDEKGLIQIVEDEVLHELDLELQR